jgi:hypothetical protein
MNKSNKPKVGAKIKYWFGDSIILKVEKYTGRYPQWFKWNVTLSNSRTRRGYIETVM